MAKTARTPQAQSPSGSCSPAAQSLLHLALANSAAPRLRLNFELHGQRIAHKHASRKHASSDGSMLRCAVLCYATQRYAMFHSAMLCYTVLCYATLCHAADRPCNFPAHLFCEAVEPSSIRVFTEYQYDSSRGAGDPEDPAAPSKISMASSPGRWQAILPWHKKAHATYVTYCHMPHISSFDMKTSPLHCPAQPCALQCTLKETAKDKEKERAASRNEQSRGNTSPSSQPKWRSLCESFRMAPKEQTGLRSTLHPDRLQACPQWSANATTSKRR